MNTLDELQARQVLQKINGLRNEIQIFTMHAKMLKSSSGNFDAAALVDEANPLLKRLGAARLEFQDADSRIDSLARSLPSRPVHGTGMSPAAQWVPQMRAASKQFAETVHAAEVALRQLYSTAFEGLNSPTRISTPAEGVLDNILLFADLLVKWVEFYKREHKK